MYIYIYIHLSLFLSLSLCNTSICVCAYMYFQRSRDDIYEIDFWRCAPEDEILAARRGLHTKYGAVCCDVLQCFAQLVVACTQVVLQCVAVCCSVLQYVAMLVVAYAQGVVQCGAVWCSVVQCVACVSLLVVACTQGAT